MRPNYKKRGDIMQKNNNRFNRVEEEMKKEISNIISNKLKNPDVTGLISVTKVKVTTDLKFAKVYLSILNAKNTKAYLLEKTIVIL